MAALQDPNPYELRPQPRPHAEPGHVHRFMLREGALRCVYCNVQETLALRFENADLKADKLKNAMDWLDLYRRLNSKYATLKMARDFCADRIALSQWPDEQRNDEERTR